MNILFFFTLTIFIIFLISGSIVLFLLKLADITGYELMVTRPGAFPIVSSIPIFVLSMLIGTVVAGIIGKIILKPIHDLNEAMTQVSQGDFDVRLSENHRVKDIAEMSASFNTMAYELSSIETLRNDFIANVSHEFKTPLATVEGYATLLQENNLSTAESTEYSQMIIDSTKQLSALSDNILKLSKLENQEIIINNTEFRLDEQIRYAILMLENNWTAKNINLHLNLPATLFFGNEELLFQVWVNLITNAVKFTPENGTVCIQLKNKNNTISVELKDTGTGMDRETLKHIFEKFYQGDSSHATEGNGLGLALVKQIITLCNGKISVESTVGKGSTFTVCLPSHR
jgi:signal transduction histidine kinase